MAFQFSTVARNASLDAIEAATGASLGDPRAFVSLAIPRAGVTAVTSRTAQSVR